MANGVLLYRGASLINGEPVVAIATGTTRVSTNRKTGAFVQVYVLPEDESPLDALFSGRDEAVCGACPLRPKALGDGTRTLGPCYVNVGQGPLAVYRAYRRGGYPEFNPQAHLELFRGQLVRLGAYGDPAAVPLAVWEAICSVARNWTGYTHAWKTADPGLARFCMASVESVADRGEALRMGYRTFRVRLPEQPLEKGEFVCPASEEAGHRMTCADCKACSGSRGGGRNASPAIVVHGLGWKVARYREVFEGTPTARE